MTTLTGADPRVSLGVRSVVRGDPLVWPLTFVRDQGDGTTLPEDLTVYGTWSSTARPAGRPDYPDAGSVTVAAVVSGVDNNVLTLTITGDLTDGMQGGDLSTGYALDLQAQSDTTGRNTPFVATLVVWKDYTHGAVDELAPATAPGTLITLPHTAGDAVTILDNAGPQGPTGPPGPTGAAPYDGGVEY